MKKNALKMPLLVLLVLGCSKIEIQEDTASESKIQNKDNSRYSDNGKFVMKENFTINLEKLKNVSAGPNLNAYRIGAECLDENTNTDYALGIPKIGKKLHFVYSSHYEPELAFDDGPKNNGPTKIFHAVKRGLNTVENAIKELNKTNGQQKQHNLFTVSYTNKPLFDDHTNMQINHGAGYPEFNNYPGWEFSHDGINSIAWVDFGKNGNDVRGIIAGNVYTVWDRNGYILERDIILQNNEYMTWAIKSDLTSPKGGTVDCRPEIDIQAVITHFALQTVGLRPLHDDLSFEPNDATIFKPTGWGPGPWVGSNDPLFAWHPHSWQTLTPGDKQGAWEAAPEHGFAMVPDIVPVADANQLILHYDFDDDLTDGIVPDQSGNNLDGNIVGNLDNDLGVRDLAVRFANNSYIDLDGKNFPGEKLPLTGYTMGVWIKADPGSFNQSFAPTIFRTLNHMGDGLSSLFVPFGHFTGLNATTSIPFVSKFYNTFVPEDQWIHLAVTFDTVSRAFVMYIDGVAVFEGVEPTPSAPSNPAGTTLVDNWDYLAHIGVWTSSGIDPFIGLMDDFVLYNYALSASDIVNLKTSGPSAVSLP